VILAASGTLVPAGRAEPPPPAATATSSAAPSAPDAAQQPKRTGTPSQRVDFVADIQPIFAMHCLKCHGPEKRSGGLRLDELPYAMDGGDSATPIIGGTLETNELYRRVSSRERAYRMPKNAAALSADEIDRIRRWVQQGTPWPALEEAGTPPAANSFDRWFARIGQWADRYQFEFEYILPYAVVFIVAQLALLAVSRAKAAYHNGRAWATGRLRWFGKFSSKTTGRELTMAWLLTLGALALAMMRGHQQKLNDDLAKLEMARAMAVSPWPKTIYGWPPVPIRPDHPKQVAGTYYRGNCERNKELFNGGNYLTCTFRINLCDANSHPVEIGDSLPPGGLYARMEIQRAPGTPDSLFSKELMGSVFLSQTFYEDAASNKLRDRPARLETLAEGQRWAARVPLGPPGPQGALAGLIYVYTGRIDGDRVRGEPQYGIKYDLYAADGKLTAQSDLWMSSFGNGAVAPPTQPKLIPFREWFDYRPIPAITGANTKDPKLLGVDEYVKKGLIKPEAPPEPPK
jgi:mono/diheme cytochrome c family protein